MRDVIYPIIGKYYGSITDDGVNLYFATDNSETLNGFASFTTEEVAAIVEFLYEALEEI